MVSANNAINDTVGASISGVTNSLTITNPSNTASSQARQLITVGGATAGDPYTQYSVSGVTDWTMGIDNNDSDALVISSTGTLGTGNTWKMTTAGERTMPLQPAFLGRGANGLNVTGDGTVYVVGSTSAWTEIYDQNGDFNTNGTFTAPVTGRYYFYACILLVGLTASHNTGDIRFLRNGSVRYAGFQNNTGAIRDLNDNVSLQLGCCIDLTAADTVQCAIQVMGGAKVVDVNNGFAGNVFFTGFLVC